MPKKKTLGSLILTLPFILSACDNNAVTSANGDEAMVEETMTYEASYTEDGALIRIDGWREWVFIGNPITPNGLNGGEAPFPESHAVYIDPDSWDHWKKTGEFREGTLIAKELSMLYPEAANEDGSTDQVSGRGFFQGGEFSGLEFAIKDSVRYADEPGNWAYFSSGHAPGIAYPDTMTAQPTESCNTCHEFNAGDDWVFLQFYPVLAEAKGGGEASE